VLFKTSRWNDKEAGDDLRRNAGVELMQQQPNYRGAAPVTAVTAQGN
jgi:hypothetical protein